MPMRVANSPRKGDAVSDTPDEETPSFKLLDERTGLEIIPRETCVRLLQAQHLGRIAVAIAGHPKIFPVNYVADGETIVFRSAEGTKFDAAVRGQHVAFEIDHFDHLYHGGWSVLVSGHAQDVTDDDELARYERLGIRPWARHPEKPHFVAIRPDFISGRRIVVLPESEEALGSPLRPL